VTATWVDIDAIKQRVTLHMIFDHYGLTGAQQGSEVRLRCPFHDDTHPSLCANVEKGIWQCFGCGLTGDAITFVMKCLQIDSGNRTADRLAAARYLAQTFGIETPRPPPAHAVHDAAVAAHDMTPAGVPTTTPCRANPPLAFTLRKLDTRHPYLFGDRRLRPETIDHFGLGMYTGPGIMTGRVVIPIHNTQGELVAYAGRWPGEPPEGEPKYRFPRHFRKSLVLFNLHRARAYAGQGLIVVEGFFSVFDLWQQGRQNVVAAMGWALSLEQKQLLVQTIGPGGSVLLAFDADAAGRHGTRHAVEQLGSEVFVRTAQLREKGGS
jgi:DNA primase